MPNLVFFSGTMKIARFCLCILIMGFCEVLPAGCRGSRIPAAALFILGDSLFDAGNNNYLKSPIGRANFWPYGETFFKHPTGRFTDAEQMKLPFIPPLLQPAAVGEKDLTVGINFASGGAGALVNTYQGRVLELLTQLKYFKDVKKHLRKKHGSSKTTKLLSRSVYMFSIGGNDYLVPFVANGKSQMLEFYTKKDYVSMVIGNLTTVLKGIYYEGGRKFVTITVPPLGRLPYTRGYNNGNRTSELTELARLRNKALPKALKKLQNELKDFKYITFDFYSLLANIISHPTRYGLMDATEGCCGSGLYRGVLNCGGDGYQLCKDVRGHGFFDAAHANENVYKQCAELMWSGDSDVIWPYNLKTLVQA